MKTAFLLFFSNQGKLLNDNKKIIYFNKTSLIDKKLEIIK